MSNELDRGALLRAHAPQGVVLAVLAVLVVLAPTFANGHDIYLLSLIGVYAIASLGLIVLTGHGGLLNLGFSGLLAIGAYVGAYLGNEGTPLGTVLVIAAGCGILTGAVIGIFALWLGDFAIAIVTFGVGIFVAFAARELEHFTGGLSGTAVFSVDPLVLYQYIWACVAIAALAGWLLLRSWFGRGLRAIRDDAVAGAMFGLPVRRTRFLAFVVTSPFATLAGALYGQTLGYVSPEGFSVFMALGFVVIVILGGITSLWGALIGSALWVMVPEWTSGVTGLYYILFGALALVLIRWAPDGAAGLIGTVARRLLGRFTSSSALSGSGPGVAGPLVSEPRKDTSS